MTLRGPVQLDSKMTRHDLGGPFNKKVRVRVVK